MLFERYVYCGSFTSHFHTRLFTVGFNLSGYLNDMIRLRLVVKGVCSLYRFEILRENTAADGFILFDVLLR